MQEDSFIVGSNAPVCNFSEVLYQGNPSVYELQHIDKSFSGVPVLRDVSLEVRPGTVHAVTGENGAGKSTLMKILAGIHRPDRGTVAINGCEVSFSHPREAIRNGIAMIHQELNLVPALTVAENIFLGREPYRRFFPVVDARAMKEKTATLFSAFGIRVDPDRQTAALPIGEQQIVEIAKALSCDAQLIIMDEPTSALEDAEVKRLFALIKNLVSRGKAVIYISHRLEEIMSIADRATVLRDGRCIDTQAVAELTREKLVSRMIGREIDAVYPERRHECGEAVLALEHLSAPPAFDDVSFTVRSGEIIGLAGLMGSGRTEVAHALFGAERITSGRVKVRGETVKLRHPADALKQKIALVPEDRKRTGLVTAQSTGVNLSLPSLGSFCFLEQVLRLHRERTAVTGMIDDLHIRPKRRETAVATLSGGNQQKVVLGKWLLGDPDILILNEPTRGVDIGAKSEIHRLMAQLAAAGKAILMISSELPELIGMSDRVVVFCRGRVNGILERSEITEADIMMRAALPGSEKDMS